MTYLSSAMLNDRGCPRLQQRDLRPPNLLSDFMGGATREKANGDARPKWTCCRDGGRLQVAPDVKKPAIGGLFRSFRAKSPRDAHTAD